MQEANIWVMLTLNASSLQSEFEKKDVLLDWSDAGFGRGFALYLFIVVGFQLNYMYLYFLVGNRKLRVNRAGESWIH